MRFFGNLVLIVLVTGWAKTAWAIDVTGRYESSSRMAFNAVAALKPRNTRLAQADRSASPLYDPFTTYNTTVWSYSDEKLGSNVGSKTWYLKANAKVDSELSLGAGKGLRLLMTSSPCKQNPKECHGAKMSAGHLSTHQDMLEGTYELRMRAPYKVSGSGHWADNGVYGYFTAGYGTSDGKGGKKWNEMNFGFHPDRDQNGTHVSCEHHDDSGGYHETNVDLGFSYRTSFNTFAINLEKGRLTWLVNGRRIHSARGSWTEKMSTRIIMRTNFRDGDPGYMSTHAFEIEYYRFTPASHSD